MVDHRLGWRRRLRLVLILLGGRSISLRWRILLILLVLLGRILLVVRGRRGITLICVILLLILLVRALGRVLLVRVVLLVVGVLGPHLHWVRLVVWRILRGRGGVVVLRWRRHRRGRTSGGSGRLLLQLLRGEDLDHLLHTLPLVLLVWGGVPGRS